MTKMWCESLDGDGWVAEWQVSELFDASEEYGATEEKLTELLMSERQVPL